MESYVHLENRLSLLPDFFLVKITCEADLSILLQVTSAQLCFLHGFILWPPYFYKMILRPE